MARSSVSVPGLAELDRSLGELPKGVRRGVLRRVGVKALEPVIAKAKQLVPVHEGKLRDSMKVSTSLSRRQKRQNARLVAEGKASVEIYAGASSLPHAHLVEFGTVNMPAQPFMRPAWEAEKENVLELIKTELASQIDKSRARLARKAERLAAKG